MVCLTVAYAGTKNGLGKMKKLHNFQTDLEKREWSNFR
jgi:hypothetical protein